MINVPTKVMEEYTYYNNSDLLGGDDPNTTQVVLCLIDAYMSESLGDYSMDWMEDNMLDLANAIRCGDNISFGVSHYYIVNKNLVLGIQGWILDRESGIKFSLENAVIALRTNIEATGIEKVE